MISNIGSGGFGNVTLAWFNAGVDKPKRKVAVKRFHAKCLSQAVSLRLIVGELELMKEKAQSQEHVVEFIGIGADDDDIQGTLFLVLEYLPGGSLKRLVADQMREWNSRPANSTDALAWCIQIASVLAALHSSEPKVLHRDIKLENVLLTSKKRPLHGQAGRMVLDVKLIDFGLARTLPATGTVPGGPVLAEPKRTPQLEKTWTKRARSKSGDAHPLLSTRRSVNTSDGGGQANGELKRDSPKPGGTPTKLGGAWPRGVHSPGKGSPVQHALSQALPRLVANASLRELRDLDLDSNSCTLTLVAEADAGTEAEDTRDDAETSRMLTGRGSTDPKEQAGVGMMPRTSVAISDEVDEPPTTAGAPDYVVLTIMPVRTVDGRQSDARGSGGDCTVGAVSRPVEIRQIDGAVVLANLPVEHRESDAGGAGGAVRRSVEIRQMDGTVVLTTLPGPPVERRESDAGGDGTVGAVGRPVEIRQTDGTILLTTLPGRHAERTQSDAGGARANGAVGRTIEIRQMDGTVLLTTLPGPPTEGRESNAGGAGGSGCPVEIRENDVAGAAGRPGESGQGGTRGHCSSAGGGAGVSGGSVAQAGTMPTGFPHLACGVADHAALSALHSPRSGGPRSVFVTVQWNDAATTTASFEAQRTPTASHMSEALAGTGATNTGDLPAALGLVQPAASVVMHDLTRETGSLMYMAPEVFTGKPYNHKADVFSFAMCAYELLHRRLMLLTIMEQHFGAPLEVKQKAVFEYARSVAAGYRPPVSPRLPGPLADLIERCWAADPLKRPNMTQVHDTLMKVMADEDLKPMDREPNECECCVVA
ncbi:hypothetical protein FOA52_006011 [Chlamydomonas sp. UWO 241]|nr:hypothetical protein FOA52_006011 [Chlamydomonas sp. UWO 241]